MCDLSQIRHGTLVWATVGPLQVFGPVSYSGELGALCVRNPYSDIKVPDSCCDSVSVISPTEFGTVDDLDLHAYVTKCLA